MTFLDTVDGKLARVTVTSSRFGDVLDHGLDIIHPPLWYIAWGVGLTATSVAGVDLPLLCWLILIGYVGGRICKAHFNFGLHHLIFSSGVHLTHLTGSSLPVATQT